MRDVRCSYSCDRCSNEFENANEQGHYPGDWGVVTLTTSTTAALTRDRKVRIEQGRPFIDSANDLCPTCLASFNAWLNDPDPVADARHLEEQTKDDE
jgi:hypothetical protein